MSKRIAFMALAVAVTALASQMVLADHGDLRIRLTGPGGQGSVRFRDRGHERRLHVELENLRLPMDTVLDMTIDGKVIGSMKVSDRRSAHLELRSRGSQTVPMIAVGATLAVVGPDGAVLMKGKF